MKRQSIPAWPLAGLGAIYIVVVFADFFAPCDPSAQNRDAPFTPPTAIHILGDNGLIQRPFVYAPSNYAEGGEQSGDKSQSRYPVHFLTHGFQYSILGSISVDWHLFGVDPPARIHLAGTDNYGRDVFSRALFGGQISLLAGLLATILSLALGALLGIIAGFYGGWVDSVIMRGVELFIALPWLYLLLGIRAVLPLNTGPERTFLLVVAVIGLVGWTRPTRLIRGVVLSTRGQGHVVAARSFGASNAYLLRRHILPETRSVVLTQAALLIPQFILAEVTLSFLGLGAGEPIASWGGMLAALQQYHVIVSDWWMFFPGVLLVFVFLNFGRISSALQRSMHAAGIAPNGQWCDESR